MENQWFHDQNSVSDISVRGFYLWDMQYMYLQQEIPMIIKPYFTTSIWQFDNQYTLFWLHVYCFDINIIFTSRNHWFCFDSFSGKILSCNVQVDYKSYVERSKNVGYHTHKNSATLHHL